MTFMLPDLWEVTKMVKMFVTTFGQRRNDIKWPTVLS